MKVVFIGHGQGGKSEAARIFAEMTGLRPAGSTSFFMREQIAEKLGVPVEQAWAERRQNREAWRTHYRAYLQGDPARVVREMLQQGDIIDGLRSRDEFEAAKAEGLFDLVVWVECPWVTPDATQHLRASDADVVIANDQRGVAYLRAKLQDFAKRVECQRQPAFSVRAGRDRGRKEISSRPRKDKAIRSPKAV